MGFAAWLLLYSCPHTFHVHLVYTALPQNSSAVLGPSGQERRGAGARKDRLINTTVSKTTSILRYLLIKGNT